MSTRLLSSLALIIIILNFLTTYSYAAVDTFEFTNLEQQQRYQHFIDEMRCPTCQNQNLSGSNSMVAMDLRKQLYTMVQSNKSDEEIVQYMLERYGDFILYKPRLTTRTIFLWGAPIGFLLFGLLILILLIQSRKKSAGNQELSTEERKELEQLLSQYSATNSKNNSESS